MGATESLKGRHSLRIALAVIGLVSFVTASFAHGNETNRPWYPSLAAFEHYDSGRSHLFPQARFGGLFSGNNTVTTVQSDEIYPSAWNITYLSPDQMFLYGGGSGNDSSSIGAYVAQIDPGTLQPVWYTQLINTSDSGEWDYPGTQALLNNGKLYVIYGVSPLEDRPCHGPCACNARTTNRPGGTSRHNVQRIQRDQRRHDRRQGILSSGWLYRSGSQRARGLS